MKRLTSAACSGGSLRVTGCRRLRVEFLPLVDIQQQPVRLAFRSIQFFTDHVRQQLGVTGSSPDFSR